MTQGSLRKAVAKIRFQSFVAVKQFVYHMLPPGLNTLVMVSVEGWQAAKNQEMGTLVSFDQLIKGVSLVAITLFLLGIALTPLERMIVLSLLVSRSATIAVKYGFRPKSEMIKFHSETDPSAALGESVFSSS